MVLLLALPVLLLVLVDVLLVVVLVRGEEAVGVAQKASLVGMGGEHLLQLLGRLLLHVHLRSGERGWGRVVKVVQ